MTNHADFVRIVKLAVRKDLFQQGFILLSEQLSLA
jgi:hypothetical protein